MTTFRIFLVEDDPWYGELLKYHLSLNPDYDIELFSSAKDCLARLHTKPDVVCIDFELPDMKGDKLLESIRSYNNSIPVIVISGQEGVAVAVGLLKAGANDYLVKDDNTKELLWNAILKIREHTSLRQEVEVLKEKLEQKYSFEKTIIGQSKAIKKTFTFIEKAVKTNVNVSITGETGTGKEVVAQAIHFNSDRRKKPFVAVNMAAIPRDLIESELFGHEKGAFTGALMQRAGKFEEANGGTLFLDEIGDLELTLQSKLLRVLQEREVVRIGGKEKIKLDIRLITATHKDLAEAVRQKNFREDLYYRIIGLPIELPPLRERGSDILVLAKHFSDEFARENKTGPFVFTEDAKNKLLAYNYPGNIRELKALIDLSCVMCEDNTISDADITFNNVISEQAFTAVEKTLREYNADIISFYLKKHDNNVMEVAKLLDIGKSSIYNMIKNKEIILL
jgi:two-component system, NtrC family, response regulator AtoC